MDGSPPYLPPLTERHGGGHRHCDAVPLTSNRVTLKRTAFAVHGALNATYGTSKLDKTEAATTYGKVASAFGWVSLRDPVLLAPASAPTVAFLLPEYGSFPQFTDMLPHTTTAAVHTGGIYTAVDKFGSMYLDNVANIPDPNPLEGGHEYVAVGTISGIKVYVTDANNTLRIIVNGELAYSGSAPEAGMRAIQLTFPFAASRHIRFETRNVLFGGLGYNTRLPACTRPQLAGHGQLSLATPGWAEPAG